MSRPSRILRILRRLHLSVGLAAALYFMLIAATGVALNHREGWGLGERYVSRTWLPSHYRPDDGGEVRMDIAIADLHSGLIFGRVGAPVMDAVAAVWFFSIVSGISMLLVRRSLQRASLKVAKR